MSRPSPLLWLALLLILLVPTAAGRVLIDLAGGLMLILLALPLLISGIGWIGWRIIQSRLVTCEACGASSFINGSSQCPICGSTNLSKNTSQKNSINSSVSSPPASSATIDVSAEDAGRDE